MRIVFVMLVFQDRSYLNKYSFKQLRKSARNIIEENALWLIEKSVLF